LNLLYLDASRDRLSIGCATVTQWVVRENIVGRHDAVLLNALNSVCQEASITLDTLEGVVVVNGPGSFTGLRIAVSAIHALDAVNSCRALPVDQLSLLAAASKRPTEAVLDARMQDAYIGRSMGATGLYQELAIVPLDSLNQGAGRICHRDDAERFPLAVSVTPSLETLRELAARQPDSAWIPAQQLTPRYIRNTVSWKPLSEQPSKLYER
jgi:tRNA threonylcarbamoyl adenosine modification protein YeaZ